MKLTYLASLPTASYKNAIPVVKNTGSILLFNYLQEESAKQEAAKRQTKIEQARQEDVSKIVVNDSALPPPVPSDRKPTNVQYPPVTPAATLKQSLQPSFGEGASLWAFLSNAVKSESVTYISTAFQKNLQNSPELQELKKRDDDFSHAMDHVELAGKDNSSDPQVAKNHLETALALFHKVSDKNNLHAQDKMESALHAMELARQLGKSPAVINHHADKAEQSLKNAKANGPLFNIKEEIAGFLHLFTWPFTNKFNEESMAQYAKRFNLFVDAEDHIENVRFGLLPKKEQEKITEEKQLQRQLYKENLIKEKRAHDLHHGLELDETRIEKEAEEYTKSWETRWRIRSFEDKL
jgi:hypothetical protein